MRARPVLLSLPIALIFAGTCFSEEDLLRRIDVAARMGKPISVAYSVGAQGAKDAAYTLTQLKDYGKDRSILVLESRNCETRMSWIRENGATRSYMHRLSATSELSGDRFIDAPIKDDIDRGFQDLIDAVGEIADFLSCYRYADNHSIEKTLEKKLGAYEIYETELKSLRGEGTALRLSFARDTFSVLMLERYGLPSLNLRLLIVQDFEVTSAGKASKRMLLEDSAKRNKYDLRLLSAMPAAEGGFEKQKASLGIAKP